MEKSNFNCEYCLTIFKNNSILINHQKTAKYCLKLRNQINDNFNCNFCKKKFSSKYNLEIHNLNCIEKNFNDQKESYEEKIKKIENYINDQKESYEEKIKKIENYINEQRESYEEKIKKLEDNIKDQKFSYENKLKEQEEKYENKNKELQEQIKELAIVAIKKPTNIQNNQKINQIINNLTPITDQHLLSNAEHLTIDHIKNGIDGMVQYALEYPLKDKIICTDFSRRKIKYKDEYGNLVDDPEMVKLTQRLFKAIEEKNGILIEQYIKELYYKYKILIMESNCEMNDQETKEYDMTLGLITDELFKLRAQKRDVIELANGNKPQLYYEFLKDICSKTVN